MPYNKTYLSNLDKESKRLVKIELSFVDDAEKLNKKIDSQYTALQDNYNELSQFSSNAGLMQQDLFDQLQDVKKQLPTLNKLIKIADDSFENGFKLRSELLNSIEAAESVSSTLEEAAKQVGIEVTSIAAYNSLINRMDDYKELVKSNEQTDKNASDNLMNARDTSAMIKNLK